MSKDNIDELGLLIHHNKRQGLLVLQKTREKKLTLFVLFVFFCFLPFAVSEHASIVLDMQRKGLEKCFRFWNHEDIYESWRKTII